MGKRKGKRLLCHVLALGMLCSLTAGAAPGGVAAKTPGTGSNSAIMTLSGEGVSDVAEKATVYQNKFEDGNTRGLVKRGDASLEIANDENHSDPGQNSVRVVDRTDTWHGAEMKLNDLVVVGSEYQFSAWVKQKSGQTEKIALKLSYTDAEGSPHYESVVPDAADGRECPDGQWVELSGEYTIPEYTGDLLLYFEAPASQTLEFYIDDLVIIGQPASVSDKFTPTDEIMADMLKSSLYSSGNNARLKKVIEKARAGQQVSMAYIGGSITEGALASPNSNCYAEVSAKLFGQKYGTNDGSNVHFINAGMSGTPSDIGVIRYDRDVIKRLPEGQDHPDILFIEFAVNDSGRATGGAAYEGMIREALRSGSAVVLIFSVFINKNVVCEMEYRPYGEHYDLPMISMGNAIDKYYKEPGFESWYYGDDLHPNNDGHKFMADCIMNLMDTVDKEEAEADNITDVDSLEVYKKNALNYQGIRMLDKATDPASDPAIISVSEGGFTGKDGATCNFQYTYNGKKNAAWFPDNWMHKSTTGNDPLKVTLYCQTVMLMYKVSNDKQFGKAELYVDGVKKATLNSYDSSGWNNGKVNLALTQPEAAVHTIELKMAPDNESKKFTLEAIGYKPGTGPVPSISPSPSPSPSPSQSPSVSPSQNTGASAAPVKPTQDTQTNKTQDVKKPAAPAIKKLKNKKGKKVTLTLKKKISGAAGYEVAYAVKASMKGQKKKSFQGTQVTVKKLKKKKTYYFRVRAYVKNGGKKTYSSWSTKKKIKIKK